MQQTDSTIIFWVFIGVGILLFLILLGMSFRANWKRATFFLVLIAIMAFLVVGANFFSFIALAIVAGFFFVFSFATLLTSWSVTAQTWFVGWIDRVLRDAQGRWLSVWNPRKAYGGAILGDMANAIGVFAGMGASRLFDNAVWWWIGQLAIVFALAVGMSLLWRTFRERNPDHYDDDDRDDKLKDANAKKYAAVINYMVGVATWLSIMLITQNNANEVRREDIRILWIIIGGLLLIYLVILTIYFNGRSYLQNNWDERKWDIFVLSWFLLGALAILGISITLMVDVNAIVASPATEIAGIVIGMLGILLWIIGEGQSWLTLSLQWNNDGFDSVEALDYLVWEKNFWEMGGGLTTLVFLSTVFADAVNGRSSTGGLQSVDTYRILFIVGATLGVFGTIRGILSGVLNDFQD